MRRPLPLAIKRTGWQAGLALLAFIQVVATFTAFVDPLYVVKWLAGAAILGSFWALGHYRISTAFLREYSLFLAILAIGFIAQIPDNIDDRAMALAGTYTLTASAAFLIAPAAFRRRSVQRFVWPPMLLGVFLGTALGEYLGYGDLLESISISEGRLRYFGAFELPNTAGTAGLIGVLLAWAAFHATRRWRYLLTIPPFVAVMVLSDSRGSVIAAAAFFGAIAVGRVARWREQRLALGACLVFLLVVTFALLNTGAFEWPDTSHLRETLNRVSTGRWDSWIESLSYLDGPWQWLFGLGLSRNVSFVGRWTFLVPVPVLGSNADNFFVDLLGRTGLVGLGLFVTIAASLALRLCVGLRRAPAAEASDRALGAGALAATLILGMTNSVIFTWAWLHAMVAWPLTVGAATRSSRPDR